ncbi:MAG: RyR domain-containing protein [Roseimicrobium sp.]
MLQNTGREADKFEADIQTGDYQGMLVLPRDAMTVQAFLHSDEPWPAALPESARERLARFTHAKFLEQNRHQHSDAAMQPWETLRDDIRGSNEDQITFAIGNLRRHRFHVVQASPGTPLFQFTDDDKDVMESMAKCEHGRWNVERIRQGWSYGLVRDPENKRSPYIVTWDKLDEGTRDWDRTVVEKYPLTLAEAGLGIMRL